MELCVYGRARYAQANFRRQKQRIHYGASSALNNRNNTCNGAYKGSLNVGAETRGDDDIEKNLRKMIPNGLIGRFLLDSPFNSPPNRQQ